MKLKNLFKKKKKEDNKYYNKEGIGYIVYQNDHVTLVHDSCKICYNKKNKPNLTYEERLKYIADKVKLGHESILEHSNIIVLLELNQNLNNELEDLLELCRYLNVKISRKDNKIYVLIGGSIRGFKHIFKNTKSLLNNLAIKTLYNLMYELPYCYFEDMIINQIFDRNKFTNLDSKVEVEMQGEEIIKQVRHMGINVEKDKYNIIGIDDISQISNTLPTDIFEVDDILDMVTISIFFKEVSRPISQQLVRHRAAITQLSQRYVDMSQGKFLAPNLFKNDYNGEYTVYIQGNKITLPLQELGDTLNGVYTQLLEQGLLKEDARAFLLNNTVTSLYMTFTIRNFIKFLELRSHKSAQAEIRLLAEDLKDDVHKYIQPHLDKDIYFYIKPMYEKIQLMYDDIEIDEVLDENVEEI